MNTGQEKTLFEGLAMVIMLLGGMGLFCWITKPRTQK